MNETPARVVVDSSVAVKWFVSEGESGVAEARALLDGHLRGVRLLCAPSHLVLEVLNALRFRGLDERDLERAGGLILDARLELTPVETLASRAAVLAATHSLTVYDAAFVALAESLGCDLLTADRRLAACPGCRTRLIGDESRRG
jgi:predicted nucleic acid-binding protein